MGLAGRRPRFIGVPAEPALGNAEQMADDRRAAGSDRHKIQQCDAMGVHLATVAAYASVDHADLACRPVVFPARSFREKVWLARMDIFGRAWRTGSTAWENLLLCAPVPPVACGWSRVDRMTRAPSHRKMLSPPACL